MNATWMVLLFLNIILSDCVSGKLFKRLLSGEDEEGEAVSSQDDDDASAGILFNSTGPDPGLKNVEYKSKQESEESEQVLELAPGSSRWSKGIVPYHIEKKSYDAIIASRIRDAMDTIEAASCVIFKDTIKESPDAKFNTWLQIDNPDNERNCVHSTRMIGYGKFLMVLGYDCMQKRDIIHSLLHALGFEDEVTHPMRDMYVRVLWDNIQSKYRSLFEIKNKPTGLLAEYDTMSVMHFHDRAFSMNGGPTVVPVISGLQINPSESLSQLDAMKLRLAFDSECNKRKYDSLVQTCKQSLGLLDALEENANNDNGVEGDDEQGKNKEEKDGEEGNDEDENDQEGIDERPKDKEKNIQGEKEDNAPTHKTPNIDIDDNVEVNVSENNKQEQSLSKNNKAKPKKDIPMNRPFMEKLKLPYESFEE